MFPCGSVVADRPALPWTLECRWCPYIIVVHARGGRRADQGAGVEAAELMRVHVWQAHHKTWNSYLAEVDDDD